MAEYFYSNDKILVATQANRLQRVVDVLTELFDRVELCTDVGQTASMECQPYSNLGGFSVEA